MHLTYVTSHTHTHTHTQRQTDGQRLGYAARYKVPLLLFQCNIILIVVVVIRKAAAAAAAAVVVTVRAET